MRFSDATGRKVVSTSTAETVGKIDGFVVDPATRSVIAVELKKTDSGDTLLWPDIFGFGADAVTVTGTDKIREATPQVTELTGKHHHLLAKRVLSALGDELGKVQDIEFDPESGQLTSLIVNDQPIDGGRLLGVGSYAVVVAAE
jgi:sporulation protein YlmC with PRC-barrel domain